MRLVLVVVVGGLLLEGAAARAEGEGKGAAESPPPGMCRTVVLRPCDPPATKKASATKKVRTSSAVAHHRKGTGRKEAALAPAVAVATALEVTPAATEPQETAPPGGGVSLAESDMPGGRVELDFALLQQALAKQRWPRQEALLFGGAPRPPEVLQAGFGLLVERRFNP